jgi:hypothetical protein
MPIIRDEPIRLPLKRHEQLLDELRKAMTSPSSGEPVVFEIPFTGTLYDVMVVWNLWEGVQADERTDIIAAAYRDCGRRVEIAQAMGVTYNEAMADHLLPYQVQPQAEPEDAEVQQAMLAEGAIPLGKGKCDLRFPNMRMAEAAHRRLVQKMPKGYWAIVTVAAYL